MGKTIVDNLVDFFQPSSIYYSREKTHNQKHTKIPHKELQIHKGNTTNGNSIVQEKSTIIIFLPNSHVFIKIYKNYYFFLFFFKSTILFHFFQNPRQVLSNDDFSFFFQNQSLILSQLWMMVRRMGINLSPVDGDGIQRQ